MKIKLNSFNSTSPCVSFDDVILVPQYSTLKTRSNISTAISLNTKNDTFNLSIPIISSPMSTVTEAHMCNCMRSLGGLGIIHRYNTIDFQARLLSYVSDGGFKAAAIGVSGDYKERLAELVSNGLKIVCIDVAHGDHILVEETIEYIKSKYDSLFIIAGNIATGSAYHRLADAGADAVRASVGSGSICTTRIQTGHGMPTLQAILDISNTRKEMLENNSGWDDNNLPYLIADGGIKNSGDIVKSLAAGADLVMLGSMLSGTRETPGKVMLNSEGQKIKRYNGMASKAAQKNWKGSYSSIEGVSATVKYKGTTTKVVNEIMSNVRSGMSYSGVSSLEELREKAVMMIQTASTNLEGNPHIYNRK